MNQEHLPIGTVVTLKDATKKIMIIGHYPMTEDNRVYDYNACMFPEGVISANKSLVFNHSQIASVDYRGLENEESREFIKNATEIVKGDLQINQAVKNDAMVVSQQAHVNTEPLETLEILPKEPNNLSPINTVNMVNSIDDIMNNSERGQY